MKSLRHSEAGVALLEVLVTLAIGCVIVAAAVGIGGHMLRAWERDTAQTAAQRTFLTALQSITNSVHAAVEVKVEGGRLVLKQVDGESVTFFLEGDRLVAQRGETTVTLARGVSRFDPVSTGSGVSIHITVGTGANAAKYEIRSDLPPWKEDWGGAGE